MPKEEGISPKNVDDDGRFHRSGTVLTASAHIIGAAIGAGVLSLAWVIAQLGWMNGPCVIILFSLVTYYTSTLLSECYRSGDSVIGERNYTYMDAVRSYLGGTKFKVCGLVQYAHLFGVCIGYTIQCSISMMAIKRSSCFHKSGGKDPCHVNNNIYMIIFGVIQIVFSQTPKMGKLYWLYLYIVAPAMSFTYLTIGLGLSIAKVIENGVVKGSITGVRVGAVTAPQKIWRSFQALGDIAFAYSYSMILIEIQDTIKSPPAESKTMKRATSISVTVTTIFFMLCGCFGYAAFGNSVPGNLLSGFGFYNPYWLIDIANVAIVIHLAGTYQIYSQPIFTFVERHASHRFQNSWVCEGSFKFNMFKLVWRSSFVIITTLVSMLIPFFNEIVGIVGAIGYWALSVYFPVEMYIVQKGIQKWSKEWICLKVLSIGCLIISIAAMVGSVAGIVREVRSHVPFKSNF